MKRMTLIISALMLGLIGTPSLASAPQWIQTDRVSEASTVSPFDYAQRQISAREARAIALARVPGGEVVDIRRTADAYRVRIIARDGRVVDIVVDANTGRVR